MNGEGEIDRERSECEGKDGTYAFVRMEPRPKPAETLVHVCLYVYILYYILTYLVSHFILLIIERRYRLFGFLKSNSKYPQQAV